jgi:hypothetical protein
LVLEIVDDVAYVGVAELFFVSLIAQVLEDLPLENRVVFTVGFCTQYLECKKFMLVALSEVLIKLRASGLFCFYFWDVALIDSLLRQVPGQPNGRVRTETDFAQDLVFSRRRYRRCTLDETRLVGTSLYPPPCRFQFLASFAGAA